MMKDIDKIKERLEGLLQYTNRSTPKDLFQDMVQVGLIDYIEHHDLKKAVSAARREERRCTKGARFGEISLDNINLVAINEADKRERSEMATRSLLLLLHLPNETFAKIINHSTRTVRTWKKEIRELLDIPASVVPGIRC